MKLPLLLLFLTCAAMGQDKVEPCPVDGGQPELSMALRFQQNVTAYYLSCKCGFGNIASIEGEKYAYQLWNIHCREHRDKLNKSQPITLSDLKSILKEYEAYCFADSTRVRVHRSKKGEMCIFDFECLAASHYSYTYTHREPSLSHFIHWMEKTKSPKRKD